MADAPIQLVHRFLRGVRPLPASDADLLARYAAQRDEAAFAELVRRHGPMVLGTAARIVGADPLADDAFQVAFLALARRAGSVRGESVAGWLHRTTVRAATRVRRKQLIALPEMERPADGDDPLAQASWSEVRQVLDREINHLPDRLRQPLVLCYLEALTRDEAAGKLGLPLRTLERRLTEGRALLQTALRRRGVGAVGLAAVAAGSWSRAVPAQAISAITSAARHVRLASGLFGMRLAIACSLLVATGLTIGLTLLQAPAADPPEKKLPSAKDTVREISTEPPLPAGALRRFGSLTWRHNGEIFQAVLSADGKTLATLSQDTLIVWDVATGRQKYAAKGLHLVPLFEPGNVAVAPDGSWVAITPAGKVAATVIDVGSGNERLAIGLTAEPPAGGAGLQFRSVWPAPDGKSILVCESKRLTSYDATTGKKKQAFDLPGRVVAISPDGKHFAVHDQSQARDAYICDAVTGKQIAQLDGNFDSPRGWAIRALFTPDSKRLATVSTLESEVHCWNAATGKSEGIYKRGKATSKFDDPRLCAIGISADGKTLYAGGLSASDVRSWDIATRKELPTRFQSMGSVANILATPDGDTLFVCGADSIVRRWNPHTGKELPAPIGHVSRAFMAKSPDDRTIVTCDVSSRLLVWNAATGKLERTIPLPGEISGPPFAFSPDGKTFACSVRPAGVRVFDALTWKLLHEWNPPDNRDQILYTMAYLADGSGLIVSNSHGVIRWDIGTKKAKWNVQGQIVALAVAPGGKSFAMSVAKGVSIRSIENGAEVLLIPVNPDPRSNVQFPIRADALAFSPDAERIAATRWDTGDVYVWDAHTGKEINRLVGHHTSSTTRIAESALAFSPDGRWLATGQSDKTVRIWEMATGHEAMRLDDLGDRVSGVGFSREGRSLVTVAGVDVLMWDLLHGSDGHADLSHLWTDLGSDNTETAYQAMKAMVAHGDGGAKFLQGKLAAAATVDRKQIEKWIADLDSKRFATREAAMRSLANLQGRAQPALRAARAKAPSEEARTRIDDLLGRLQKHLSGLESRPLRAMQVIQWIGTDSARQLATDLAKGAEGDRLTEAARMTAKLISK